MIQKLVSRLNKLKNTGTIINMIDMYPCLTSDIICQYAFGAPYGYLEMPEFAPLWHKAVMDASEGFHFFKQFPWLETTLRKIPQPIVRKMVPNLASLFLLTDMIREKVDQVQVDLAGHKKPDGQRNIFHDLFTDDHLSPEEKSAERLAAEGVGIVSAGSMTVAHTLSVTSYHIIANPKILRKLQEELAAALPNDGSNAQWSKLEQLPYLTPVGMTSVLMHNNTALFPEPQTFDPERWLQADSARLRKYIVAFSRGSRQCLGM
ncbi:MAG: hypothetical protein Q9200_004625, partial [Gallowayella weberi]